MDVALCMRIDKLGCIQGQACLPHHREACPAPAREPCRDLPGASCQPSPQRSAPRRLARSLRPGASPPRGSRARGLPLLPSPRPSAGWSLLLSPPTARWMSCSLPGNEVVSYASFLMFSGSQRVFVCTEPAMCMQARANAPGTFEKYARRKACFHALSWPFIQQRQPKGRGGFSELSSVHAGQQGRGRSRRRSSQQPSAQRGGKGEPRQEEEGPEAADSAVHHHAAPVLNSIST